MGPKASPTAELLSSGADRGDCVEELRKGMDGMRAPASEVRSIAPTLGRGVDAARSVVGDLRD